MAVDIAGMIQGVMKGAEESAIKSNPKLDAFMHNEKNKAFIDGMKRTIDQEFGNDPEVTGALQNFRMGLVRDQNGAFIGELEKIIEKHPEAQQNLTSFIREHKDIARGVILNAGQNPDAILDIAEMGRLASDPAPAAPAQTVAASAPETTQQSVAADAPAAGTPSPATPSGRQKVGPLPTAAEAGGIDMNNLGAGLQDMLSKLTTLFEALPRIFEAISQMFTKGFAGIEKNLAGGAGNGGPDGPLANLTKALGIDTSKTPYQYGDADPKVGMVGFDPAQPGVYRDQQAPAPNNQLDRSPNPGMHLRPGEAVS